MQRFPTALRRQARTSRVALCGLAAAAALTIAGCGGSGKTTTTNGSSTSSAPTGHSINAPLDNVSGRSDLLSIMQDDSELSANPSEAINTMATQWGANTIRTIIYWQNFAPDPNSHTKPKGFDATNPADYSKHVWSVLDAADRAAASNHVTLYVTLDSLAPVWATGADPAKGVSIHAWKPSATDFEQWVKAVGLRYSGNYTPHGQSSPLPRIDFWSIGNEPNYGVQIAPDTTDHGTVSSGAAQYRTLVEAGWNGLAATGHTPQTDTILIGETAPRGALHPTLPAQGQMPLPFIQALYCVDSGNKPLTGTAASQIGCPTTAAARRAFVRQNPALFKASGWADHPYPDAQAPNVGTEPPGVTGYADFANLGGLMDTLDAATAAHGQKVRFPIYNTEFGYQTGSLSPYPQLTQSQAEIWMNQAEYLSWRNTRIRSYDQYLLYDPTPKTSTFDSGLLTYNGVAKLTAYGYQMPLWMPKTSAAKGHALDVWGCARPAPQLARTSHKAQVLQIQLSTDGGKTFKTIKSVTLDPAKDGCYINTPVTFPASGLVRINWPAGNHYSRFQQITIG